MPSLPRRPWLVAALAFAVPVAFALFTRHAWEDYFITLRSSRHLAEGQGLVFTPGERLHTFTSPLGVLVPAACTWLVGPGREEAALWLFRVIGAGLLGAGAWIAWRRAESLGLGRLGRAVLFGLLLADAKLTDFATNGMETALLVFALLWFWSELEAPDGPRGVRLGLVSGLLMWVRPDAFVLGGCLGFARLVFRRTPSGSQPPVLGALVRAALVGGLVYLPWFAWAWWYYGTPVPHTITAKAAFTPPVHAADLLVLPWQLVTGRGVMVDLFLPSYWVFGGWPEQLHRVAHVLSLLAATLWLVPGVPSPGRRASLAVFLGMFYCGSIILFPWYVPPWTALAAIALAFGADQAYAAAQRRGGRALVFAVRIAAALVLVCQVTMLVATAWQMRQQQRLVEEGVRRPIGEWLHTHAAPHDTVFLEPLGYIGYYSQLRTYDFPGLSSNEVVDAVRHGATSYAALIDTLRPVWVVLRPDELVRPEFRQRPALANYEVVAQWTALPELDRVRYLPGRPWCEFESRFFLLHRKPDPGRPAGN